MVLVELDCTRIGVEVALQHDIEPLSQHDIMGDTDEADVPACRIPSRLRFRPDPPHLPVCPPFLGPLGLVLPRFRSRFALAATKLAGRTLHLRDGLHVARISGNVFGPVGSAKPAEVTAGARTFNRLAARRIRRK
jgi:hypothetical protein